MEVLARLNDPETKRYNVARTRRKRPLSFLVLQEPWKPKAAASRPLSPYRPLWFLSSNLPTVGLESQP